MKKKNFILSSILALIFTFSFFTSSVFADDSTDISTKIEEKTKEIDAQTSLLEEVTNDIEQTNKDIEQSKISIQNLTEAFNVNAKLLQTKRQENNLIYNILSAKSFSDIINSTSQIQKLTSETQNQYKSLVQLQKDQEDKIKSLTKKEEDVKQTLSELKKINTDLIAEQRKISGNQQLSSTLSGLVTENNVATLLKPEVGNFPEPNPSTYPTKYPYGQCTWYAYGRMIEIGRPIEWFSGDAGNGGWWGESARAAGYKVDHTPAVGAALSIPGYLGGCDPYCGHITVIEEVYADGSVRVSESNVVGPGIVSYRTFDADFVAKTNIIHA